MDLPLRAKRLTIILALASALLAPRPGRAESDRVTTLIQDLEAKDARTVDAALRELAGLGQEASPALPAMMRVVERRDRRLVGPLHQVLLGLGETTVPVLASYLSQAEGPSRWQLLAVLEELGPRSVASVPTLIALVDPREAHVMERLERTVASIREAAVPAVLEAIPGADLDRKRSYIRMIGRMGWEGAAATPAFVALQAHDEDIEVRLEATRALFGIAPHAVLIPLITNSLGDPEPRLRELATDVILRLGESAASARPQLLVALRDEHEAVVDGALEALLGLGGDAAELLEALRDPDTVFVGGLVRSLLGLRARMFPGEEEELLASLQGLLEDESEHVRLSALEGLNDWGMGASDASSALADYLLEDARSESEMLEGLSALEAVGAEPGLALPALLKALKSPHDEVRRSAADSLGKTGTVTRATRRALHRAARDENPAVSEAAASAWTAIKARATKD